MRKQAKSASECLCYDYLYLVMITNIKIAVYCNDIIMINCIMCQLSYIIWLSIYLELYTFFNFVICATTALGFNINYFVYEFKLQLTVCTVIFLNKS